jgi:hypothetical protein
MIIKRQQKQRDKSFKIKLLIQALVRNYQQWGISQENLSFDEMLEKHTTAVRGKKWYRFLFTRMTGMTVINAHLVYNRWN